jgi:hypothetical protein
MLHAGELVSKADLTEHIYQQDFDRDSNVLEVFIGRLRKKLDPDGALKPIETVRGRGYRFAIPRSGEARYFRGAEKPDIFAKRSRWLLTRRYTDRLDRFVHARDLMFSLPRAKGAADGGAT